MENFHDSNITVTSTTPSDVRQFSFFANPYNEVVKMPAIVIYDLLKLEMKIRL